MTDVSIPTAVSQHEDEADQLWRENFGPNAKAPDEAVDETADAESPPEAEVPATTATPETDWQHKYLVLQGKYDAEVPRLHDEIRYLSERADRVPPVSEEPATTTTDDETTVLTDYLGEDAAKAVQALLAKQRRELEVRLDQAAKLGAHSAQERFWDRVRATFPNYAEMQADPALNDWLNASWPGARQSRHQEAMAAYEQLDAERFIALLQAYSPAAAAAPASVRTPPAPTPRRAAGGGTVPADKAAMNSADYGKQMEKAMKLRSFGQYAEADALEKTLDLAVAEGRVARS